MTTNTRMKVGTCNALSGNTASRVFQGGGHDAGWGRVARCLAHNGWRYESVPPRSGPGGDQALRVCRVFISKAPGSSPLRTPPPYSSQHRDGVSGPG
jgi:hypothetical protein